MSEGGREPPELLYPPRSSPVFDPGISYDCRTYLCVPSRLFVNSYQASECRSFGFSSHCISSATFATGNGTLECSLTRHDCAFMRDESMKPAELEVGQAEAESAVTPCGRNEVEVRQGTMVAEKHEPAHQSEIESIMQQGTDSSGAKEMIRKYVPGKEPLLDPIVETLLSDGFKDVPPTDLVVSLGGRRRVELRHSLWDNQFGSLALRCDGTWSGFSTFGPFASGVSVSFEMDIDGPAHDQRMWFREVDDRYAALIPRIVDGIFREYGHVFKTTRRAIASNLHLLEVTIGACTPDSHHWSLWFRVEPVQHWVIVDFHEWEPVCIGIDG